MDDSEALPCMEGKSGSSSVISSKASSVTFSMYIAE